MNPKKTSKKLLIATALLSMLIGVVIGYWMLQRQVGTRFYVRPSYNLKVFDTDGVTDLTFIEMGELDKNVEKWFPGGHDGFLGWTPYGTYFLNNTNEMTLYVGITVEGAPPGMNWTFVFWRLDQGPTEITIDTTSPTEVIYQHPLEGSISANPELIGYDRSARCYLKVLATSAVLGETEYTATVVFNAYDSIPA